MTTDAAPKPESSLTVDPLADTTDQTCALSTSLGGRVRKTTRMFTFTQAKSDDPVVFLPPVGRGQKVREMEFVASNIEALGKKQVDMMKQLYSIMYGRRFQQKNVKVIKEHILDFSGILEQDEKSREQLVAKMGKWKLVFVHEVMDLLAVDRSKKSCEEQGKPHSKETLLDRLVEWLYNPQTTKLAEKKAALGAKKEKQKLNKRMKAATKRENEPTKKKRKMVKKRAVAADEDEDEDVSEASEAEADDSASDLKDAKKLTKKRVVSRRSKTSRIVESDDEDASDDVETTAAKDEKQSSREACILEKERTMEIKTTAEEPHDSENVTSEAGISTAAGQGDSKPATEALGADVCSKVRDIIARGDAQELTVKKIVRQLSADLGRDMSAQKKAIKQFIQTEV